MTILFQSDFNYASGTLLSAIDANWGNATYTTGVTPSENLKVDSAQRLYSTSSIAVAVYATAPPSPDYAGEMVVSIVATNGSTRLLFRDQGTTTASLYMLRYSAGSVQWLVGVSGSYTALGTAHSVSDTAGASYTIRGEVEGDQLRAYVNGVLVDTVTDTTHASAGKFSASVSSTQARMSSLLLETLGGDTTAPILAAPTATATGSTTYSGTVNTNEANGTLYYLISASATATATEVKAGASQAVTATGVQNVSGSGLTASTSYYLHYLHRDTAGNDSIVVTSAQFTTDAEDTTAPVLTNPTGAATDSTTASGAVTTDEANGTLYAVVTTSATPPSAADIRAGTGAAYATSQAVSVTGMQSVAAAGLTASTTYYWHFLHDDASANASNIVTSASFTTSAADTAAGITVTEPLKNNTGTLLASQSGVRVAVLQAIDLVSVHEQTGLTTDAFGLLPTISDAAIVPATSYHVVIKLADGSVGITGPVTAS